MPSASAPRGAWPLVGAVAALAVTGGLIFDGYRGAQEATKQSTATPRERRAATVPSESRSQSLTTVASKTRSAAAPSAGTTRRAVKSQTEVVERPRGASVASVRATDIRRPSGNMNTRLVRPVNDETSATMPEGDERNSQLEAAADQESESMGRRFWDDEEVTDEEIAAEQNSFEPEMAAETTLVSTPAAPRFAQLPAPPATTAPPAATPMATAPAASPPMSEPAAKPSSSGTSGGTSGTGSSSSGSSSSSGTGSGTTASSPPPPAAAPRPISKGKQTLRTAGEKMIGRAKKAIEGGVYAGGELTFIAPLREPEQLVGIADFTTGQVWQQTGVSGIGTGVRMWAGVMPEDQGFRVRYFTMANDQLKADPVFPQFAQPAFSSASHYDIHSLDLEFTQIFPMGHHRIDASFGVRMAELSLQSSTVGYADVGNGVSVYGMAMAANEMQGIGFTGSIGGFIHIQDLLGPKAEARLGAPGPKTPFQEWVMNWGLFYNIRGTALWSETAVSVLTDANAVVQGNTSAAAFSRNQATAMGDERQITGNFELQFGFEYEKKLEKLPTSLVMRIGFEYQRWALGEVEASSRSQAFLSGTETQPFGGGVRALADRNDSYLDLFGIAVAVGLSY
jgi:hypothetical protein